MLQTTDNRQGDLISGRVTRETPIRRRTWAEEKAAVMGWIDTLADWQRAELADVLRDSVPADDALAAAGELLVALNAQRKRLKPNSRGLVVPEPLDPKHPNIKQQLARLREGLAKSDLAAIMVRRARAVSTDDYRLEWLVPSTIWNRTYAHKRTAELPPEDQQ